MDAYLLYSDLKFLDTALDAAYEILIPKGSDKIVLPCRTPNICRLLCNCYYFTGDVECGMLAKNLVTETLGVSRKFSCMELGDWWWAIRAYESVIGEMDVFIEEKERLAGGRMRLGVSVEQIEDEKIEDFQQNGSDVCLIAKAFDILARREFAVCNEFYSKIE